MCRLSTSTIPGVSYKKRRKSYFDFTSDLFFHICTTVLIQIWKKKKKKTDHVWNQNMICVFFFLLCLPSGGSRGGALGARAPPPPPPFINKFITFRAAFYNIAARLRCLLISARMNSTTVLYPGPPDTRSYSPPPRPSYRARNQQHPPPPPRSSFWARI